MPVGAGPSTRSPRATAAPARASRTATARPMSPRPPETRATWPASQCSGAATLRQDLAHGFGGGLGQGVHVLLGVGVGDVAALQVQRQLEHAALQLAQAVP